MDDNLHMVKTEAIEIPEDIEKQWPLAKTSEEWEAIEREERKTFKGKIKYAWQDYIYYPLYRTWIKVKDFPSEVKYFYQRGRRGYSDRDAWGIDDYLNSFMPELLRHMIDEKKGGGTGYPGHDDDPNCDTAEHWNQIVEKMARGFEAAREMDDIEYQNSEEYRKKYEDLKKEFEEGIELFGKYYFHLWD